MSRIDDGHPTRLTFSTNQSDITLMLWEKECTPPGISGGGANDTTTMRNEVWRTRAPKKLKTLTDGSLVAAYDPLVFNEILEVINVNQEMMVTFPDDSTLTFWGWIDSFIPSNIVEGEQPTADLVLMPSNQNAAGVETAPVAAAA